VEHKIEDGIVTEIRFVTDQVTDISPIRIFNALRVLDCQSTHQGPANLGSRGRLADLAPLKGMDLSNLTYLSLRVTKVGDADMALFKDCKNLTTLRLYGTQLSDAGVAYFKNCKKLNHLDLAGTAVTETGLANFKDCRDLMVLYLSNTKVSDAGLANFKDCKKLTTLFIGGTDMTNTGLAYFKDCKYLTRLSIAYTKATDLSLLEGMPLKELNCEFQRERDAEILRSITTLERINGKPAAEFWKEADSQATTARHTN
jgi:Leucine-rich repeat (LRR) protein